MLIISSIAFSQSEQLSSISLYNLHEQNSKRGQPGVQFSVELKRDGQTRFVPLNTVFKKGDKVKFYFKTNFNSYVRLINIGSSSSVQLLYPYNEKTPQLVTKSTQYSIPMEDHWFEFDETPGSERLIFIFSSQPIKNNDAQSEQPQFLQDDKKQNTPQIAVNIDEQALKNGKDLKIVADKKSNASYAVATHNLLSKPIGIRINLQHK